MEEGGGAYWTRVGWAEGDTCSTHTQATAAVAAAPATRGRGSGRREGG